MPSYISGDAELSYEVLGSPVFELRPQGLDVVLLHPTPVHHGFWMPLAEKLIPHHRVILPDLRGHGRSQPGQGPISIARLGEDIQLLLDILGVQRAFFAGCSIGGYTLFELWRRIPGRIAAMAFCCSKPQPDSPANKQKRMEWIEEVRAEGTARFFNAMAASLIGPTARERDPRRMIDAHAMMQLTPEAVVAVQQGLGARPDSVQTARTITVPTCVIAGGEDESSTPDEMKVLAETIRNAGYSSEYHMIADAGHYAPWEQPEVVGLLLGRFFESVGKPAR